MTIRLVGQSLEFARSVMKVRDAHNKDMRELEVEFAQRRAALTAQLQSRLKLLFPMILEAVGLNRAETDKWGLELKYLAEHGIAFLTPLEPQTQVSDNDVEAAKKAVKH